MITTECDVESVGDYCQYYRSCWVGKIPENPDDEVIPYSVQGSPGGSNVRFVETNKNQSVDVPFSKIAGTFYFGRPTLGCRNFKDSYVYTYSYPARDQSKGLRPERINIWLPQEYTLFKSMAKRFHIDTFSLTTNPEIVSSLFNPSFNTLSEAMEEMSNGEKIGRALSNKFGIYVSQDHAHPLISYKHRTVGYLDVNNLEVVFNSDEQYLEELFKAQVNTTGFFTTVK